jgi:NAD(P)-dependent dehydrogenase (short-subunit alcohol dehydrogenase family)
MDFRDKVCVITGASSGIGRRLALDLGAAGAQVCAAARREERLRSLIKELAGDRHSLVATDVSDRAACGRLADHVRDRYGRCDVLVNNAGFSLGGSFDGPAALERLHEVMATNFFGAAYCTASLMDLLVRSAPSHVVNVASVAGRIATGGASSYCASKFAMVGWSEALYFELRPKRVHVTLIEPGMLPTEGFPHSGLSSDRWLRHILTSESDVSRATMRAIQACKLQRTIPRWFYPLEIARLVAPPVFRALQSRFITARAERESRQRAGAT